MDSLVPAPALGRRAATAVWGIPLTVLLVILGGPWLVAGVAALVAVGLGEFYRMTERIGYQPVWEGGLLTGLLFVAAAARPASALVTWAPLALAALFVYTLLRQLLRGRPDRGLANTGITLLGAFYVGYLMSYVVRLRDLPASAGGSASPLPALLVICVVWGADTAAYFVGLRYGRHKLIPRISPHKSREGAAAAVLAGIAIGVLFAWVLRLPVAMGGTVGALCAAAGICGDLWESAIKRETGVKDAGSVLPGHGGVLDRFDGLLLAGVTGYAVMRWWLGA